MTCADALRVEHLEEALGLHVRRPRLSWRLPDGASNQSAYRLRASNGWDTGRVAGAQSILVPYDGPPLRSSERVSWQVKVWTDAGEHDWSPPAWFEMGLLEPGDWRARWIGPVEDHLRPAGERPAALLRWEFVGADAVVDAGSSSSSLSPGTL